MAFWFVGGGALAGLLAALAVDDDLAALALGAAIGWILWRQRQLGRRLATFEAGLARSAQGIPAVEAAAEEVEAAGVEGPGPHPVDAPHDGDIEPEPAPALDEPVPARLLAPPAPDLFDRVKVWFTEGNVPVKVGVLVLLAGVAALLRYASSEGWLRLPIELRLSGIALAAVAGLAFGFRERSRRRSFGLALQGGAIGVLTLTVFASFRLYDLLPAGGAFALLVALVVAAGFLAVLQDAVSLAVLGLLAGFAAPILVSTGAGNHVALFGWYAILDLAVVAVAWFRTWRILNLLGFVFTFAIAAAWGVLRYDPSLFATTEPFLAIFFLVYLAIPILGSRDGRSWVEGSIVFGNPLVTLAMQAALLRGDSFALAFSALGMAAIYVALALYLAKRGGARLLVESFAVLAVGFATLAVPLALGAQATAGIFALEGAALVWIGTRQERRGAFRLALPGGLLLQVLGAIAFIASLGGSRGALPLLNGAFLGGLWLVVGGLGSAWATWRAGSRRLAAALLLWAIGWWAIDGLREIDAFVGWEDRPHAVLAFAALSAWLLAELHRTTREALVAWISGAAFLAAILVAYGQGLAASTPADPSMLGSWVVLVACGLRALPALREAGRAALATAHVAWLWSTIVVASFLLRRIAEKAELASGWEALAFFFPAVATSLIATWRPGLLAAPLRERFHTYRRALTGSLAAAIVLLLLVTLGHDGDAAPLAYLPLVNPLDLAWLACVVSIGAWLAHDAPAPLASRRTLALGAIALVLLTASTLRAVHHLADLRWEPSVVASTEAQAALTVVWSVLGVGGWIAGSRLRSRSLWLAGALLMAVVLGKLAIVDRQHLGNLAGIVSFLAFGVLCTVVGYFAPAPPRPDPTP